MSIDGAMTGLLEALDRVLGRGVLLGLELLEGDLPVVVGLVSLLELHGSRKRAYELGGDRHA